MWWNREQEPEWSRGNGDLRGPQFLTGPANADTDDLCPLLNEAIWIGTESETRQFRCCFCVLSLLEIRNDKYLQIYLPIFKDFYLVLAGSH